MDYLYPIAAMASALAAVLAWLAKLRWSKEYAAAKDEVIRAKDARIETLEREIQGLRELTPMKIREYFVSVKTQLEEYNEHLKSRLEEADRALGAKNKEIERVSAEGTLDQALVAEKDKLQGQIAELRQDVEHLQKSLSLMQIPEILRWS